VGRVSQRRTIQFVRKLLAPDGTFDGIVVVSLDPYDLSRFYDSLEIGQGSIMLMNRDGVILARAPTPDNVIGSVLAPEALTRVANAGATETYRVKSAVDGVERIYSIRRLESYPLTVSVGLAVQDVFAAYERNQRLYLFAGFLLTLAGIAAGYVMLRQQSFILESRQALAATLENMSQGIMMVDAEGNLPVINQRAIALLGLPPALMARNPSFQDIVDWQIANQEFGPADAGDPDIARRLRGGGIADGPHVYERTRPNGVVLEVRTRPLPGRAAVRTFTDVTEQRRNEQALEAAHERAAHAERMQALGQLAGGIAHDFNNILQVVQGGASLIKQRTGDPGSTERLARMIVDATERGTSITRRLLSFARRGELSAEPVEPGPLLDALREVLIHTLGASIKLQVVLRGGLPSLLADKGQLETVLVNLAANARDAMPDGGTLTFAATAETVTEAAIHAADLRPGRYIHLSVSDTGVGMDRETVGRVTEPFFTTKPLGKGTGLGLSMAKGFTEQSGGGLTIDSAPGRGTTIHIWLPTADAAATQQVPLQGPITLSEAVATSDVSAIQAAERTTVADRPAADDPTRRRVLLVDQAAQERAMLASSLRDAGYTVLVADNTAGALRLLDTGAPVDVLVADLGNSESDPLALIRQAQRDHPPLPTVLMTAYAADSTQHAVSGVLSGSFALLRKPVTGAQLADRIGALLAISAPS
jgi:signal transduction histidine kinase/ActR/RegA family two-component response regulator